MTKTKQSSVRDFLKQSSITYKAKKVPHKEIFKWVRRGIYLFLFSMALIGCFQQIIDPSIQTSPLPGAGGEICYPQDATNGFIVDPASGKILAYNPISTWHQAWAHGPFYGLFVYPFALFLMTLIHTWSGTIGAGFSALIAIFLLVIIIRTITLLFTIPQLKLQAHMQTLQTKVAEIKAKYGTEKTSADKQKEQLEIMSIYKRNNFNPMALMLGSFVTMPFFYAMYRCTAMVRDIKVTSLGPFDFNTGIWTGIAHMHQWWYIAILVVVIPVQFLAIKIQSLLNYKNNRKLDAKAKKAYRKNQMVFNVMFVFFIFINFSVPLALVLYWLFSNIYTIFQTLGIHYYQKNSKNKNMRLKVKAT